MSTGDYAVQCFPIWHRLHQAELVGKTEDEIFSLFADYWESLGEGET